MQVDQTYRPLFPLVIDGIFRQQKVCGLSTFRFVAYVRLNLLQLKWLTVNFAPKSRKLIGKQYKCCLSAAYLVLTWLTRLTPNIPSIVPEQKKHFRADIFFLISQASKPKIVELYIPFGLLPH